MNRRLIKCIIAVIIMCAAMSVPAGVRSAQAKSSVGVVNTDGLNIRSGAGTGYVVVTHNGAGIKLNTGAKVNILGEYPVDGTRFHLHIRANHIQDTLHLCI